MSRDYKVYIQDILEAIEKIQKYTAGMTLKSFAGNEMTIDAVVRNLEILGEAVKKIPEEIRKEHPAIEWKKISGIRDILIHEYFGIDVEIIWDIVQHKLLVLKTAVEKILKGLSPRAY